VTTIEFAKTYLLSQKEEEIRLTVFEPTQQEKPPPKEVDGRKSSDVKGDMYQSHMCKKLGTH
jgi:hypothetical protein